MDEEMTKQIQTLNRIVIEGNGEQPLTVRVATIESKINGILWAVCTTGAAVITDLLSHVNWSVFLNH